MEKEGFEKLEFNATPDSTYVKEEAHPDVLKKEEYNSIDQFLLVDLRGKKNIEDEKEKITQALKAAQSDFTSLNLLTEKYGHLLSYQNTKEKEIKTKEEFVDALLVELSDIERFRERLSTLEN